jgi:DNA modification methylase
MPDFKLPTFEEYILHTGKSEEILQNYPDNHFDSIVTDSPYGIRFMGKSWDDFDIQKNFDDRNSKAKNEDVREGRKSNGFGKAIFAGQYDRSPAAMLEFQQWFAMMSREFFRVLKPGGYFLNFSSPRTYHRMACGVEEAGFEIRDQIMWLFASGFPKSHNLDGEHTGWGTALKPAHEPIVVARKPFDGTVKQNMDEFGVSALNIDGCRIELNGDYKSKPNGRPSLTGLDDNYDRSNANQPDEQGRWPANIIHDGSQLIIDQFPESKGQQGRVGPEHGDKKSINTYGDYGARHVMEPRSDSGSAARFFYCAKTSPLDRNEGLPDGILNDHPTVKPTDLMRYLIRLVTPKGGLVLDPFRGSGSTGKAAMYEHCKFVGIDMDEKWESISRYRIEYAIRNRDIQIPLFS